MPEIRRILRLRERSASGLTGASGARLGVYCIGVLGLVALLILSGCSSWKVEDAFDGEFNSNENNRIINDYCQSCHIHSTFTGPQHMDTMAQLYKRKVFRYATECRTCHFIEVSWLFDEVKRKTRTPDEANRGEFRSFELDTLKDQRERRENLQEEEKKNTITKPDEDQSFLGIF